jgi:predicted restriction endonuclease
MKKFKCEFPNCEYEVNDKHLVHKHHIIPKELNGKNDKMNIIYLCPNHHSRIFIPNSNRGIHSLKVDDKIIIFGFLSSTFGKILHYSNMNNEEFYYNYITKQILKVSTN